MRAFSRFLPDALVMLAAIYAGSRLLSWCRPSRLIGALQWFNTAFLAIGIVLTAFGVFHSPIAYHLMNVRGSALAWGFCLCAMVTIAWLFKRWENRPFLAGRRRMLRAAGAAAMSVPAGVTTFGILVGREQFRLREVDIKIKGLPDDLHRLRLVQLSDIHLSPFLSRAELRRCVDMANETRAHAAFVTGDLVTGSYDPLEDCLTELKRLKSDAGTFGCMGNHEAYIQAEAFVKQQALRQGMDFLRAENRTLRFGHTRLNLAGVDYQPRRKPYLTQAPWLLRSGEFNLLLSHNPDVFPVARRQGWNLTLGGHTHGGQVNVEILEQDLNLVRAFVTPYVYGLYEEDNAAIYVTRGIGTVGVPVRLGCPPEVALIRLCAT